MLSILGRMNPAVCLGGGSLSAVHEDTAGDNDVAVPISPDDSSRGSSGVARRSNGRGGVSGSFGGNCVTPPGCYSRYQPEDDVLPFPPDVYRNLSRTLPALLARISASPPTTFPDGASQKERRNALREFNAGKTGALQRLHDLTRKGCEHNRVPLVCGGAGRHWEGDVIGVLSAALMTSVAKEEGPEKTTIEGGAKQPRGGKPDFDENRRLICWTLNNLTVPYQNKAAVSLGEHSAVLLRALTGAIRCNLPEAYLCCICLLNLTFLADAVRPVAFYVPPACGDGHRPPYSPSRTRSLNARHGLSSSGRPPTSPFSRSSRSLRAKSRSTTGRSAWADDDGRISEICGLVLGNPLSLMRVLEQLMATNAPFLPSKIQPNVHREAIRWACGFIRNVTYAEEGRAEKGDQGGEWGGSMGRRGTISNDCIEEVCMLVSLTEMPQLIVQFVKESPYNPVDWSKDSLEDICLGVMCNLASWSSSQEALRRAGAVRCLERLEGLPGIHGYRARAIRCSLGAPPMQFG